MTDIYPSREKTDREKNHRHRLCIVPDPLLAPLWMLNLFDRRGETLHPRSDPPVAGGNIKEVGQTATNSIAAKFKKISKTLSA
jgi:hypothetical protein